MEAGIEDGLDRRTINSGRKGFKAPCGNTSADRSSSSSGRSSTSVTRITSSMSHGKRQGKFICRAQFVHKAIQSAKKQYRLSTSHWSSVDDEFWIYGIQQQEFFWTTECIFILSASYILLLPGMKVEGVPYVLDTCWLATAKKDPKELKVGLDNVAVRLPPFMWVTWVQIPCMEGTTSSRRDPLTLPV